METDVLLKRLLPIPYLLFQTGRVLLYDQHLPSTQILGGQGQIGGRLQFGEHAYTAEEDGVQVD